jgi:hypothetical protein
MDQAKAVELRPAFKPIRRRYDFRMEAWAAIHATADMNGFEIAAVPSEF